MQLHWVATDSDGQFVDVYQHMAEADVDCEGIGTVNLEVRSWTHTVEDDSPREEEAGKLELTFDDATQIDKMIALLEKLRSVMTAAQRE